MDIHLSGTDRRRVRERQGRPAGAEDPNRGAIERTYMLRTHGARVRPEDIAAMTAEEHRQAFMAFVAGMVSDFDRYLARGDINLARDRVSYRMAGLWLTDEEFRELVREIGTAIGRKLPNGPTDGRTRRLMRTILLPGEP